jgi:hypothetical protein
MGVNWPYMKVNLSAMMAIQMKWVPLILIFAFLGGTPIIAKKKPPAPQDPPPGRVHSYEEGMAMITAPLNAALSKIRIGAKTSTSRNCIVSSDLLLMRELEKCKAANDQTGIDELASKNATANIGVGTRVLIIEVSGADEIGARVSAIMSRYQQYAEKMIRLCEGMRSIECTFPLAPSVIPDPLPALKLRVRILDGERKGIAGWLYPADLVLPAEADAQ